MSFKNFVYKLLDAINFNKGFACRVNGFKIYFPAKWFRYFENNYEKDNVAFLKTSCKPGMTVIDIGAHLGLMSSVCAQLLGDSGKVYAFEPTPATFTVLKKVIHLNGADNIIVPHNKAISNFTGQLDFFVDEHEGSNANSLVSRDDKKRSTRKIDVTTLDTFSAEQGLTRLDLLKIDAEGSEQDVLAGARQSLLRFRPRIILAMHPPLIKNNHQNQGDIYDLIVSMSYDVFFKSKPLSREEFCSVTDLFDVHLIPKTTV